MQGYKWKQLKIRRSLSESTSDTWSSLTHFPRLYVYYYNVQIWDCSRDYPKPLKQVKKITNEKN